MEALPRRRSGAVWDDGTTVSTKFLQRPTQSDQGPEAVVRGWVEAITDYLGTNGLAWEQVHGVGLAIPGPFQRYGVLDRSANLPASFAGFDIHAGFRNALADKAGRSGSPGGRQRRRTWGAWPRRSACAARHRHGGDARARARALAAAFIDRNGLPLDGDTLAGMEAGHMPAPLHLLQAKPYPCGCGRTWGCVEVYTTLSGLPYLLADRLTRHPEHELARSTLPDGERAFALRGLAQKGDALAVEIFDFQARALGLHVANLAMAFDPQFVVIGGGLMDPEATTGRLPRAISSRGPRTAAPYLFPAQRARLSIVPAALGDLSQAIGSALVALYQGRS